LIRDGTDAVGLSAQISQSEEQIPAQERIKLDKSKFEFKRMLDEERIMKQH
jgi:hypothetical protein